MFWKIASAEILKSNSKLHTCLAESMEITSKKLIFSRVIGFQHTHKMFQRQIQEPNEHLRQSF